MKKYTSLSATLFFVLTACAFAQDKKTVDPSGTWRWEYDFQGESVKDQAFLQLEKDNKVTGKIFSTLRDKALEIKRGKVSGSRISFDVIADFEGTEVALEFSGKIKGDELQGDVTADANGQIMEFPWTPKRSVELSDVVGQWNLTIESPDGDTDSKLVIQRDGKKFKAVQSGDSIGKAAVKDLAVKDNQLVYSIVAEYEGSELKARLKGRPYGNSMSGTIDVEVDGNELELPFTGQRKVKAKKKAKKND